MRSKAFSLGNKNGLLNYLANITLDDAVIDPLLAEAQEQGLDEDLAAIYDALHYVNERGTLEGYDGDLDSIRCLLSDILFYTEIDKAEDIFAALGPDMSQGFVDALATKFRETDLFWQLYHVDNGSLIRTLKHFAPREAVEGDVFSTREMSDALDQVHYNISSFHEVAIIENVKDYVLAQHDAKAAPLDALEEGFHTAIMVVLSQYFRQTGYELKHPNDIYFPMAYANLLYFNQTQLEQHLVFLNNTIDYVKQSRDKRGLMMVYCAFGQLFDWSLSQNEAMKDVTKKALREIEPLLEDVKRKSMWLLAGLRPRMQDIDKLVYQVVDDNEYSRVLHCLAFHCDQLQCVIKIPGAGGPSSGVQHALPAQSTSVSGTLLFSTGMPTGARDSERQPERQQAEEAQLADLSVRLGTLRVSPPRAAHRAGASRREELLHATQASQNGSKPSPLDKKNTKAGLQALRGMR